MGLSPDKIEKLKEYCIKNQIVYLGVFGSYARGSNSKGSDIDLLAEFNGNVGLIRIARIKRELSDLLGIPVDFLTKDALSPYLRAEILSTVQDLYEKAG